MLKGIHHIAIICSDYNRSKLFYTQVLGLKVIKETYREHRDSFKLDLALNDKYVIELFSFPNPPKRVSKPEACGLRHLAFEVVSIEDTIKALNKKNIDTEPVRIDELTDKKFTFFSIVDLRSCSNVR